MASNRDDFDEDTLVNVYRQQLKEKLQPVQLVPYLATHLDTGAFTNIRKADKTLGSAEATDVLIHELQNCGQPGWYAALLNALREAGFPYLLRILKGHTKIPRENEAVFRQLMQAYMPDIMKIFPRMLLPYLLQHDCISEMDAQQVTACAEQEGNTYAAILLISEHIANRQENWFPMFLDALNRTGHEHISRKLHESFAKAGSFESICVVAENYADLEHGRKTQDDIDEQKRMNKLRASQEEGSIVVSASGEPNEQNLFSPPQQLQSLPSTVTGGFSGPQRREEHRVTVENVHFLRPDVQTKNVFDNVNEDVTLAKKTAQRNDGMLNDFSLPPPQRDAGPTLTSEEASQLAEFDNDHRNLVVVATPEKVLPVAARLAKTHCADGAKVLYVTADDLDHSYSVFMQALRSYRVLKMKKEHSNSIAQLVQHYDVFIAAPHMLMDAADKIDIFGCVLMSDCQYAMQEGHPYRTIGTKTHMQLIGLTSSVGVSSRHNMEKAVEHIKQLCAQLSAHKLILLSNSGKAKPKEQTFEYPHRTENIFHLRVSQLMAAIETRLTKNAELPYQREEEMYGQWLQTLIQQLPTSNRKMQKNCLFHLKIYHIGLMINEACRTQDALMFIRQEISQCDSTSDDISKWLHSLYQDQLPALQSIGCQDESDTLSGLRQHLAEKTDILLLCPNRHVAKMIELWMKKDARLQRLSPYRMSVPTRRGEDASQYFRKGAYKVIIGTDEKGLDTSKCSYVMKIKPGSITCTQNAGPSSSLPVGIEAEALRHVSRLILIQQVPSSPRSMPSPPQKQPETRKINGVWKLQCSCNICNAVCVTSEHIRIVHNDKDHYLAVDPALPTRTFIMPLDKPVYRDSGINKMGRVFCKECRSEWGLLVEYRGKHFARIKLASFKLVDSDNTISKPSGWKNVPFTIVEMQQTDLDLDMAWTMHSER